MNNFNRSVLSFQWLLYVPVLSRFTQRLFYFFLKLPSVRIGLFLQTLILPKLLWYLLQIVWKSQIMSLLIFSFTDKVNSLSHRCQLPCVFPQMRFFLHFQSLHFLINFMKFLSIRLKFLLNSLPFFLNLLKLF